MTDEYRADPDDTDGWFSAFWDSGYSWCRPCGEYHRLPECAIEGQLVMREIESKSTPKSVEERAGRA